jgi:hypothetical protein
MSSVDAAATTNLSPQTAPRDRESSIRNGAAANK